ncbi:anaerobic C4-dicarboxylate transporter [Escherichia coli]|nr:anaerobic C4-dicarboxylate transporter [Escherichia coli]EFU9701735.1 anaerobic C4-dicarboxylate transporter [Escherichia coli]
MLVVELIIVLLAIFLGARLGGIGIGFAGGLGVLVLAAIGVKPGNIPFDVISIIMAVIAAISAMQVAGGLDYLVHQTEKLLRRNPKYITILAPIVTYFLTIFAGTGNISLATLPVIAEVAKEQGVKPCRPLSTAVVSAQIAITASPISAAVVYMSSVMEGHGISYLHLLSVVIPSTLLAVLVMSFLVTMLFNSKLSDDPIYRKRLEEGLVELRGEKQIEIKSGAKTSVWLFLLGVVGVVIYAIINSPSMGLVEKPLMNTTYAYPVKVNGRYVMDPSPIPKFDNPKMDMMPALQLFGAGREKRIYAVPPFTRVESLDFDDHPFTVQQWDEPCAICGSTHSYLDEVVLDDAGNRMFVCSDTDYCRQQSEAKSQ